MAFKKTAVLSGLLESGNTSAYWNNLDVPVTKKEFGNVTHLEFSPVAPYNLAVTSSSKVQIYSSRSNELVRSLNRFNQAASCGSFRSDGKLLVAGSDDKMVRLFEPSNKSLLRVFKGHTEAVLVTKFLSDNQRIMSASRDKTVRLWDIAAEKEVLQYQEFEDYIKCGVTSRSSPDIFLTGSYDHTAKLFDSRTSSCVLSVDHGHPVESVLLFPSNGIFLTAGGNVVKVWDALAGGRQLTQLCNHHKTVMALSFCTNYKRFMSGSSDRHVKIYDVTSYQVVHSLDYPANILSLAVAPDDSVVAVGMEGGLLSIQKRVKSTKVETTKRKAPLQYTVKYKHFKPHADDMVVAHTRKEKLERYDKLLKRFEHSKALDAALEPHLRNQFPEKTMGVLQELKRRGALRTALAGRDTRQLEAVLKFIQKNICKPHFSPLLDVIDIVLELYEDQISGNAVLEAAFRKVKETMDAEQSYQMGLMSLKGMLETFFAASESVPETDTNVEGEEEPSTEAALIPSAAAKADVVQVVK